MKKQIKAINILLTIAATGLLFQTAIIFFDTKKTNTLYSLSKENSDISREESAILNQNQDEKKINYSQKNFFNNTKKSRPLDNISTFKLKGTVVTENNLSLAVIENTATGKQNIYALNDSLTIYKITDIQRKFIILSDPLSKTKTLYIDKKSTLNKADSSQNIKKIADHKWLIKKETIEDTLGNINAFLKQVRIIPHFTDGASDGFTLTNIEQESFLRKIGIKNGDILKAVNGITIDNPYTAIKALKSLMANSKEQVTLVIERSNKNLTLSYQIENL